jgi:4-amino-4-deoxy-L-arabinose transferase-like glycosyltransferase
MSKSKIFWLVFVIIIIASFFRLYQLKTVPPGLYPDEAMEGNNALQIIHGGSFKVFYPENNGREGLFVNILVFFIKFLGNEPWVIRLPMAIAGILTVLGIYFLAAELFGPATGLLTSFLVAVSFWHILFSRIGFRAMLAPMLLVWSVYFLLLALRRLNSKRYFLYSVIGGIIYGLGFYTYIAYRVTPVLVLFVIAYLWKKADAPARKKILLSAGCFLFLTFLTALPIGYYFLKHPADFTGRTSEISIFGSAHPLQDLGWNILKTAGMFNFHGDYNWRQNLSGQPELFWPVGILFVLGVLLGIIKLWRWFRRRIAAGTSPTEPFALMLVFLWFILAALPVVISDEGIPHALRSILMIPPVFMLTALAGVRLYRFLQKYNPEWLLKAVAIIFFIFVTLGTYQQYFVTWAKNKNTADAYSADYVEIGNEINALPPETPKYVIVQASGVLAGGVPMPAQTVMFITDTYLPKYQQLKNIHYVLPTDEKNIPAGAAKFYLK